MIEIANFINENETTIKSLEQLTFLLRHIQQKNFLENSILMNLNFGFMKTPFIFLRVLLILRFAANL